MLDIKRERERAALQFAKDRDLAKLEATLTRLDGEAEMAVARPRRVPTAAEARTWLESLPELWTKTSDAGRHAIAEAVFERIDVLRANDFTVALTAHAKVHGWDAAFGAGDQSISIGQSGRGERTRRATTDPSDHEAARRAARAVRLAAQRMTRRRDPLAGHLRVRSRAGAARMWRWTVPRRLDSGRTKAVLLGVRPCSPPSLQQRDLMAHGS